MVVFEGRGRPRTSEENKGNPCAPERPPRPPWSLSGCSGQPLLQPGCSRRRFDLFAEAFMNHWPPRPWHINLSANPLAFGVLEQASSYLWARDEQRPFYQPFRETMARVGWHSRAMPCLTMLGRERKDHTMTLTSWLGLASCTRLRWAGDGLGFLPPP